MTLKEDLANALDDILDTDFAQRSGTTVPRSGVIGFHQAVNLGATYLYADLADSSGLVNLASKEVTGKVIRAYLGCAVRIIRSRDGHIRSFDGDRVMAIFHGADRDDRAVDAALRIKGAIKDMIQPAIERQFSALRGSGWEMKHGCGVARGDAMLIRAGIRDNSDIVSIGVVPNLAAKLSDIREGAYSTIIGKATYGQLSSHNLSSDGASMWKGPYVLEVGGKNYNYYQSSYFRHN